MVGKRNIESAIQRELIKWLAITYPQVRAYYNKNEGQKDLISAKLDKLMGLLAGRPDLDLEIDQDNITHILELELKKLKGVLNAAQKEYHKNFRPTMNKRIAIVYGLTDAQQKINLWLASIK